MAPGHSGTLVNSAVAITSCDCLVQRTGKPAAASPCLLCWQHILKLLTPSEKEFVFRVASSFLHLLAALRIKLRVLYVLGGYFAS